MAFPADPLDVTVSLAIGADINADPATWVWTDVTPLVREDRKISITRGRRSRVGQVVATTVSATADNTDGALCRHNPNSPHFGVLKKNTPMKVEIDNGSGDVVRAAVFVPGLPPSWDPSEADQVVTLNGVGILDRLGRGRVLSSAPYRYIADLTGTVPVGAWALEEGPLVSGGAPLWGSEEMRPFVGTHPSGAVISYPEWGRGTLAPWLPNVVSRSNSAGLTALWARVSMPSFSNTWTVDHAYASGTAGPGGAIDVNPSYLGGSLGWPQLTLDPGAGTISVSFDGSPETTTSAPGTFDGRVHHVRWTATQNGAGVDWVVYVDSRSVNTGTEATYTLPAISKIALVSEASSAAVANGYLTVWTTPQPVAEFTSAVMGHAGEMAHDRLGRLCAGAGIRFTCAATESAVMGPQRPANLLSNLRDCANADLGVLYESMDFGLAYRALSERYNATAAITLQYDQSHILPPWEPNDDDQEYFNDVTASRPGGSSARSADEDDIDEVGSYAIPANPNVDADDQLANYASWLKSLGLIDELSWPAVRPNLYESGALRTAWLAAEIGDELHITGHPSPLAPDTIRQVIEGYTETIGSSTWTASAVLSSASPYIVAELDSPTLGKLDTSGSVLHAAVTSTATTFEVATTTTGRTWSTDNAEDGFDWRIGGERVTVTDIAPSAVTYVSAGTASSGSSGSRTPGLPGSAASGDLVLIFASTRNSGTGIPDTPTSWTRLPVFEAASNAQVFGRLYDGVWSMPTVTYTGGAANEDTIAQSAAFRGKFHDVANVVVGHASCLNASAQDITAPGLPVNELPADMVAIYMGWKQDDYTSVAAPGSWTEIQEASSTAGNDASQVWGYRLFTSVPAVGSLRPAIAVTGGGSAISRGAVVAIRCDYQTATVTRSVNEVVKAHSAGADVRLWTPWRWAL